MSSEQYNKIKPWLDIGKFIGMVLIAGAGWVYALGFGEANRTADTESISRSVADLREIVLSLNSEVISMDKSVTVLEETRFSAADGKEIWREISALQRQVGENRIYIDQLRERERIN